MRISPLVVSIGALAALSGWLVRGIQLNAETSPLPQPTSQPVTKAVAAQSSDAPVQLSVDRPVDLSHTAGSTRNLFAYREPEIPPARPAVFQPPPVVVDVPVAPPPVIVEERPRLRFPHRYIGRFGPKDRPIAAFARDGDIVTVKVGGRIDDRFVLRSVGVESVDVEASVNGELQTERVALSSSL
jgi:hypothetical protein